MLIPPWREKHPSPRAIKGFFIRRGGFRMTGSCYVTIWENRLLFTGMFLSACLLPIHSEEATKPQATTQLPVARQFVDAPKRLPILPGSMDPKLLPAEIESLVSKLGHDEFKAREEGQARLVELAGQDAGSVRQLLKRHADHSDPEIRHRIKTILAAIKEVSTEELLDLAANGLKIEAIEKLDQGGAAVGARMVDLHVQCRLGFDIIYSLSPDAVLPRAFQLLDLQGELYYKILLAKLIEGVLSRAILPVLESRRSVASLRGIQFFRDNPKHAATIRALLLAHHDELRLTAVRICAHGLIDLDQSQFSALLKDADPDIVAESQRLACLLQPWNPRDVIPSDITRWVDVCLKALDQHADELAHVGAYQALADLLDRHPAELYAALGKVEGRPKDALTHILTGDAPGRLILLKMENKIGPTSPSPTLARLLALRRYDILQQSLPELMGAKCASVAPLVRRNLVNLSMTGNRISRETLKLFVHEITDPALCRAAVDFHMNDLLDLLRIASKSALNKEPGVEMEDALRQMTDDGKGELAAPEHPEWYQACAEHLESDHVDVATGALRGILTSGKAGAFALARHWLQLRAAEGTDAEYLQYLRSLCVFHPYTHWILDEINDTELKEKWDIRGLKLESTYKAGKEYTGGADDLPFALWGFMHPDDGKFIKPVGNRIVSQLRPFHVPLLLSWIDHHSRIAIFLAAMNAREAIPAILRRVNQRRTDWRLCYDHDIFHGIVVFEMLEATPVLENYTKTNTSWPFQGLEAMAGIEMSRFCWTKHLTAGRANPLAVPAVNELLALSKKRPEIIRSDSGNQHGVKALVRMGYALQQGRLHGIWRSWEKEGRGAGQPRFFVDGKEVSKDEYAEARKTDSTLPEDFHEE